MARGPIPLKNLCGNKKFIIILTPHVISDVPLLSVVYYLLQLSRFAFPTSPRSDVDGLAIQPEVEMLRPARPDSTTPEAEVAGRQLATFVRGNLNFSVERVSDSTGRAIGVGVRSPTSGYASKPEVVSESGPGRSRLASRTGNSDRMRLIVEENGRCMVISNPGAGRSAVHDSGNTFHSRTSSAAGRPRSSEGWERGELDIQRPGRVTGAGPMSPVCGVRTARSSSGSLPRLGRSLVAGTVCTSPSLPAEVPPRTGGIQSPGVAGGFWWKAEKQPRDSSDGSQNSYNTTSTPQRPTSKDEDG